ncbi:hypothetical protein KPP03845_200064 (plasmid) [Streptomyces xanthophaeus]|nr:hypothetical protein KPP03845_200064 [Streptomyces xanthophaeus]
MLSGSPPSPHRSSGNEVRRRARAAVFKNPHQTEAGALCLGDRLVATVIRGRELPLGVFIAVLRYSQASTPRSRGVLAFCVSGPLAQFWAELAPGCFSGWHPSRRRWLGSVAVGCG